MGYGAGQENYVVDEGRQTPTDKYKVILMETLKECIKLDVNEEDKKFIRSVDQLNNLMRLYAVHRADISKQYRDNVKDMEAEIEKMKADTLKGHSTPQKEQIETKIRYEYAKKGLALIIDMMNNSPIIEKEMEGLYYSPTTLEGYAKIRERFKAVSVE